MTQDSNLAELLGVSAAWTAAARSSGFAGFLSAQDQFAHDPTKPDQAGPSVKMTGIYFWIADNGEAYVGQAVDIRRRLKTHFKDNPDLIAAAYLICDPKNLDHQEKSKVAQLEGQFALRNVLLVKQSAKHRPLDTIIAVNAQQKFLGTGNAIGWQHTRRRRFPILERRQRQRVTRMAARAQRMELGQVVVTFFVDACIPDPFATEHRFWSVTAFEKGDMIARVNVGVQEVLTVHDCSSIRLLCPEKLTWRASRPLYRSGARAHNLSFDKCTALLKDQTALNALRTHVVSLMRHTTALNARSHCPAMLRPELITEGQNAA